MTITRITVRLALGILCGVALVLLPAVFSTAPSTVHQVTGQPQLSNAGLYGLSGSGPAGLSFFIIIVFIFLPSTVFSFLVRRWAERHARDYL